MYTILNYETILKQTYIDVIILEINKFLIKYSAQILLTLFVQNAVGSHFI